MSTKLHVWPAPWRAFRRTYLVEGNSYRKGAVVMWPMRSKNGNPENDWQLLAQVCDLQMGPECLLAVQLRVPVLDHLALQLVVDRILDHADPGCLRGLDFDFAAVRLIDGQWTAIPALLIKLARCLRVPCRVRGLTGQPARVFELYARSEDVRRLVTAA